MKKLLILFSIMIMTAAASSSFSVCQKHLIEKHKTEVLHPHLQMPEYIMSDKELEYLDKFLEDGKTHNKYVDKKVLSFLYLSKKCEKQEYLASH